MSVQVGQNDKFNPQTSSDNVGMVWHETSGEGFEMMAIHHCRFCGGKRPHNGSLCLGCGADVATCNPSQVRIRSVECPKCTHGGPHQIVSTRRRRCVKCTAIFEGANVGFIDDRPEINAAKKERAERERKKPR